MADEILSDKIEKKPYRAPKLTSYGGVKDLTSSGSSAGAETGNTTPANAMMRMASDRRTKFNVVEVGRHPIGVPLYLFDYKPEFKEACGHGRRLGVMADEVVQVCPEAVSLRADGYAQVDYGMLGIEAA